MRSPDRTVTPNRFASLPHPNRHPEPYLNITPARIFAESDQRIFAFLNQLPAQERQLVISALWHYSVGLAGEVEITETELELMLKKAH